MPGEDWKVEYSEQASDAVSGDPALAEFVREATARMRQVINEFEAGKFKSLEDALRSIGMVPVDEDESKTRLHETK